MRAELWLSCSCLASDASTCFSSRLGERHHAIMLYYHAQRKWVKIRISIPAHPRYPVSALSSLVLDRQACFWKVEQE